MIEQQETLIAELLCGGSAFDQFIEIADSIDEKIFTDRNCQIVYQAIKTLALDGQQVSLSTVAGQLELTDKIRHIGGFAYLSAITDRAYTAANIRTTAQHVVELYFKQRIALIGEALAKAAKNGTDVFQLAEKTMIEMQSVLERGETDRTVTLDDAIRMVDDEYLSVKAGDKSLMIPTGITTLDDKLHGGIRRNSYVVFGARPSTGKSNIGFNLIVNMKDYCRIGFVSAEMDTVSVTQRMLSTVGGFNDIHLSQAKLSHDHERSYEKAKNDLTGSKVLINDQPHMGIMRVEAMAKKWKREHKIDLLIVDYLQLLDNSGRSRENEVAGISKTLKRISREVCTVVALAQLNRGVEGVPKLSDLRESGTIEQDADTVVLLHDFFAEGKKEIPQGLGSFSGMDSRNILTMLIEKNRRGTRKVMAFTNFNKETGKITGLDSHYGSNPPEAYHNEGPAPF